MHLGGFAPGEKVIMYPNLKLQLFKTGMRQNRLAQCLGMDESILSKMINGFREPSPEQREKIASLLGGDVEWLFQQADPPNNHGGNMASDAASASSSQMPRPS